MLRNLILFGLVSLAGLAMVRIGLETSWRTVSRMQADSGRADKILRIAASPIGGGVNGSYLEQLAKTSTSEPERREWLRRAIETDPRNADAWTALGLSQERDGLTDDAETSLLAAAGRSKDFDPAWTLANFYFRRQRLDAFWAWLEVAARRAPDGYLPLLQLADRCAEGPGEVISRLAPALDRSDPNADGSNQPGAQTRLLWGYLDYLIGQQRLLDAAQVAERLLSMEPDEPGTASSPVRSQSAARAANLVDRMIDAGLGEQAAMLWARVENARLGRAGPRDEKAPGILGFDSQPSGLGFDWKLKDCPGVRIAWQPGEIVAQFDGSQPDDCVFLTRVVRVDAARSYRVKLYRQSQSPSPAPRGLRANLNGILSLAGDGRSVPLVPEHAALIADSIPSPEGEFAELRFLYQRPPGAPRQAFRIRITQVKLEVL